MLFKGAEPVCISSILSFEEFRLHKDFVRELRQQFPFLTHETIATDLFRCAVNRETITRIFSRHSGSDWFQPTTSYVIVTGLLTLPEITIHSRRETWRHGKLTEEDRAIIRNMLSDYGVSCACGSCCALAKEKVSA